MANFRPQEVLKDKTLTSGTEQWVAIGAEDGAVVGIQIVWHDTTTAFDAPVFYTTNRSSPPIPDDGDAAPDLEYWSLEASVVGTAVAAGAAGSQMYHLGNNGARQVLVKINPTTNSLLSVYANLKDG